MAWTAPVYPLDGRSSRAENGPALCDESFLDFGPGNGELNSWAIMLNGTAALTARLCSCKSNLDIKNGFGSLATVVSRVDRHLLDADVETNYVEYLNLMKLEVDEQLNKLKEDIRGLENYTLPGNGHANSSRLGMSCDVKLIEIDERFNGLKLQLAVVFQQITEMLGSVGASLSDVQWEHKLQLEVIAIMIGDCISGLLEELERKLYEQSTIMYSMSSKWQETVAELAAMREDLAAISKLLLPSKPESHISHSKHENSGNRSHRWKYNFFGKKTKEGCAPSSTEDNWNSGTQKSVSAKEVISEDSDFHHLMGMTREEMINYFKSEISKLKRSHELALQNKTEDLFKFKREKGSVALKNDMEFEPLRKTIPDIVSRMDQIISKNIKVPAVFITHNEIDLRCKLNSRINSLYHENQHLQGLLADKTKDVEELSYQLSDTRRKMLLQSSLEQEYWRQIDKIRGEYEDLQIECNVRDGLYQAMLSEKEKALCLANEEKQKLKEKLAELEKECFSQDHKDDPEVIKQESMEMTLHDIKMELRSLPRRSLVTYEQDLQHEVLIKLNQNLEIASTTLEEVEKNNLNYIDILCENEQEKQLECILTPVMDLSKEFVETEHKLSKEVAENRSENLSDQCNHMVKQTVVLTKKSLWYKQMLETRRSDLQKAEAQVNILGDKVNALLNLLQKMNVTIDHYAPVFQHYPGLLDAFLKTCKLVSGLRSKQDED